jgi:hypothetical protein
MRSSALSSRLSLRWIPGHGRVYGELCDDATEPAERLGVSRSSKSVQGGVCPLKAWCRGADRGRIESMPKVRKGAQSRRSGRFVAANDEVRLVPRDFIVAADLLPRRKSETAVLKANPEELTKAVARATEVFGDEEAAFRWFGTPVAALDYATPISCLGTHQGAMRVNDVLTQIEHGVW